MLVIPDIHGRSFWQEAVEARPEEKVVFLGDYLDPYSNEGLGYEDVLAQLERLIALKRERGDQVVLLLGNHDLSYLYPQVLMCSRHDYRHRDVLRGLLWENLDCFGMAHVEVVAGKRYLFSHAGVLPGWVSAHADLFGGAGSYDELVGLFNRFLQEWSMSFVVSLGDVSFRRGGHKVCGSMIWADVDEFEESLLPESVYQVFGHSQQREHPVIRPGYACLDCRRAFVLDEKDGSLVAWS